MSSSAHIQGDTTFAARTVSSLPPAPVLDIRDPQTGETLHLHFHGDDDARRMRDALTAYLREDPDAVTAAADAAIEVLLRALTDGRNAGELANEVEVYGTAIQEALDAFGGMS